MSTFALSQASLRKGLEMLVEIYGDEVGNATYDRLLTIIKEAQKRKRETQPCSRGKGQGTYGLSETDAFLITYGDQFLDDKTPPLLNFHRFAGEYLAGIFSGIHILPFYPYSSDDGFSVTDYYGVRSDLGNWEDIKLLSRDFRLMFDAVINHSSVESTWFQGYLKGDPTYNQFFIEVDKDADLSSVIRPRALPLLTPFLTEGGVKLLWTTFSADQMDLNYANPNVLLEVIRLLLFYANQGARLIRLDAVGYLWKEIGTTCLHLWQTHRIIQLFRYVLDMIYPDVLLVTETNVPHEENISYFGDGRDEAQVVYQFPLPPLVLSAFYQEDASTLARWVASLKKPPGQCTFFNFLASHDGIGLLPAKGILTDREIQLLVEKSQANGGSITYRHSTTGEKSPYELNISYFDALSGRDEPEALRIGKFICAHSIILTLAGVPAIYVHSLFGSGNYYEGVKETGRLRSINREKLSLHSVLMELKDPGSRTGAVYNRLATMLKTRRNRLAFHPQGRQEVLFLKDEIFSLIRTSPDGRDRIICFHNLSCAHQNVQLDSSCIDAEPVLGYQDLLTERKVFSDDCGSFSLTLQPYEVLWLVPYEGY